MKVTKHNVGSILSSYLVKNRIPFAVIEDDSSKILLEAFVGPILIYVTSEFDLDSSINDNFTIETLFRMDHSNEFHTIHMDSSTYIEVDHTDVESIMEKVVSKSREMEEVFDSISELIYSIVEICESNKLDPSIFIPNYKKF
jgi:hypothetical protein